MRTAARYRIVEKRKEAAAIKLKLACAKQDRRFFKQKWKGSNETIRNFDNVLAEVEGEITRSKS